MGVLRWESDPAVLDRFLRIANPSSWSACWRWSGLVTHKDYGRMKIGGRQHAAHRVAYIFAYGSIPEGLQIDHLCKTRRCVNPTHLEAVTSHENNMRSDCVSGVNAAKEACPAGHPYNAENTYEWHGCRQCRPCTAARMRARRAAAKDAIYARYLGGEQQ